VILKRDESGSSVLQCSFLSSMTLNSAVNWCVTGMFLIESTTQYSEFYRPMQVMLKFRTTMEKNQIQKQPSAN